MFKCSSNPFLHVMGKDHQYHKPLRTHNQIFPVLSLTAMWQEDVPAIRASRDVRGTLLKPSTLLKSAQTVPMLVSNEERGHQ